MHIYICITKRFSGRAAMQRQKVMNNDSLNMTKGNGQNPFDSADVGQIRIRKKGQPAVVVEVKIYFT